MCTLLKFNYYSFKPNSYLLGKRAKLNLLHSTKATDLPSMRTLFFKALEEI